MHVEERWGESVIMQLSKNLRLALPGVDGLSKSNIYYCKKFYQLYNQAGTVFQQAVGKIGMEPLSELNGLDRLSLLGEIDRSEKFQQLVGVFQIPWGHHCVIMDYAKGDTCKALFFVRKTMENNWSRNVLLNMMASGLYERCSLASGFQVRNPAPAS